MIKLIVLKARKKKADIRVNDDENIRGEKKKPEL